MSRTEKKPEDILKRGLVILYQLVQVSKFSLSRPSVVMLGSFPSAAFIPLRIINTPDEQNLALERKTRTRIQRALLGDFKIWPGPTSFNGFPW